MFAGLQGLHLLIILIILSPVIIAAIGIPIAVTQGRARREAGLVTDPRVNPLAVTTFVFSSFVDVAGLVCGHMPRAQIRRSGEAGWCLATFGLFLGC
ncbi:hypothetical protein ACVLV4_002368 [Rathayibacter agropyri]